MSRKGIQENDPFDWEKASADGSLTTTTASSTQGNYNPTPQGLKPDIAATNISELPRTNDPLLNDDSIKDDNARQKEKRRWSLAEGELAKDEVEQIQKRPMESALPIDVIDGLAEGKKPKLKTNKVSILQFIPFLFIITTIIIIVNIRFSCYCWQKAPSILSTAFNPLLYESIFSQFSSLCHFSISLLNI